MASNIESNGKTVTVTTSDGHRIGFAMTELNVESTAGEITTEWAGGVPPNDPEAVVRAAKVDAEAHTVEHDPGRPDDQRASREKNKGIGGAIKDFIGLP